VGAGSGLSFYPNIFFFGSDFLSIRPEPDPLPSLNMIEITSLFFILQTGALKARTQLPS
jgi:hypothetical protein